MQRQQEHRLHNGNNSFGVAIRENKGARGRMKEFCGFLIELNYIFLQEKKSSFFTIQTGRWLKWPILSRRLPKLLKDGTIMRRFISKFSIFWFLGCREL